MYTNPRPIDRVLERLEGVRAHNGYFMARCPAHDDNEPSLSVSEGEDSRALIKCFAGCSFAAVVEALGLDEQDLFTEGEGGIYPSKTSATVQHPPEKAHRNADKPLHAPDATPKNSGATPPAPAQNAAGVTLESYTEYVGLPVAYLKSLGLREIHYVDQKAVKIPYLDRRGEEVCVRFRVALTGSPKIKTRKGDKHRLYGLQSIDEMRNTGFCILVEGESDAHVGWYHEQPVIGIPGASGFQSDWTGELDGFEKIYAVVEPDEAGEQFWQRLATESSLQERLYRVDLAGVKDLRELHLQNQEQFVINLHEALGRAVHWMDIAESEALERSRKAWERCSDLASKKTS